MKFAAEVMLKSCLFCRPSFPWNEILSCGTELFEWVD